MNVDKRAELNWLLMLKNDGPARKDFVDRFEKDTAFYFHQQLTQDEKERKAELKQLDIPIDRVRPIIRRIVSKVVKGKPTIVALSEDLSSADLSRRVNAQIQYAMRISKGLSQTRRCVMNSARGGLGYLYAYTDNLSQNGQTEVKFKYVSPKLVFVDHKCTDTLFDDARQIQILEKVSVSDAIKIFKDSKLQKKIINSANTSYQDETVVNDFNDVGSILVGSAMEDSYDEFDSAESIANNIYGWVEILTTLRKKVRPVYTAIVKSESGRTLRYVVNKEEAKEVKRQGGEVEITYAPYIHEEVTTPIEFLREQSFESLDEYPITPMVWEDTENPYPVSETFFIRGPQRLQNKYYEVILSNAQAVSFPNTIFETGAYANKDEAMRQSSIPGGQIEVNSGVLSSGKIQRTYAAPLNQAFFQLYEQLKHEQEVQSSAYALSSGDPSQIPETNKALVNLDSFSDRPLAINVDAIESCLERVFKNIIKLQSVTYTEEKILLIDTNPKNNVTVNKPTLELATDGQPIVTQIENDITRIDYDISLVPGSMSPLDRTTEYQYAVQAVQFGATPEFALKKMPVEGIDEEIIRIDTVRALQQQNEQLMSGIEQMHAELNKAYGQAEKSEKAKVSAEYRNEYDVMAAKMESMMMQLKGVLRSAQRQNEVINKKIVAQMGQASEKKNPSKKE